MKKFEQLHLPDSVNKLDEKQELGSQKRLVYLLPWQIACQCDIQGTRFPAKNEIQ